MNSEHLTSLLAKLIWQRKVNHEVPYVLLLGAGASLTSGGSNHRNLIDDFVEKYGALERTADFDTKRMTFNQILGQMGDENRYLLLKEYFKGKEPARGYRLLADLIKQGFFRLIFTTNFDTFLEDALFDADLRTCDFQTLVCGKDAPDSLTKMVAHPTPQVKIVKLHGDLNARIFAFLPDEVFQFTTSIQKLLGTHLNQNVIIIGHSMLDNDINRTIEANGGEVWYVNPTPPPADSFIGKATQVRKSYLIQEASGYFDNFMESLYHHLEIQSHYEKTAMTPLPTGNTDFENRIYDLDFLCDPTKPRFVGIDAPAGYGKTYLLQEVQRRMRKTDWFCPLIDLSQNPAAQYDPVALLKEIAQQAFSQEIAVNQVEILEKELIKLFLKEKVKRILLLVDSVHTLKPPVVKWFRDNFIPDFDQAISDYNLPLRIILTGRYLAAEWSKAPFPFHIRRLTPFEPPIIQDMIDKFAARAVGQTLKKERTAAIAHEIYAITGGHPRCIRSILEEMAQNMFIMISSDEEYMRLFNTHVAYVVDEILQGVAATIQTVLQTLSVLRKFNADTLDALITKNEINAYPDGFELLPEITATRLIDAPSANNPMYSDRIVRRILSARLKFHNPTRFIQLHQFSEQLYNHWIRSQDILGNALPIPITDQWQLIFIVESLYHALHTIDVKNPEQALIEILQRCKTNLAQIKSAFPDNLANIGIQLKDALVNDLEIRNHTRYLLNDQAFDAILALVQNFINHKGVVE